MMMAHAASAISRGGIDFEKRKNGQ